MNEKLTSNCCPDYEKEYYRLIDEVNGLKCANHKLREIILGMCEVLFLEDNNNGKL